MHGSYKDQLKRAIHESLKTQRNWDLDKEMPQEDIDLIMEAATQCPTRQNIPFYNVTAITDRTPIEKIHAATQCFPMAHPDVDLSEYAKFVAQGSDIKKPAEPEVIAMKTNPQVLGQLLLAFSPNEETYYERDKDMMGRTMRDKRKPCATGSATPWDKDVMISIGIAVGYVKFISTQLGYRSGCCGCMEEEVNEIVGDKVHLLMGVGIPDESRHRTEHHREPDFRFPSFRGVKTMCPVKVEWLN
jgi:hypothetical protein